MRRRDALGPWSALALVVACVWMVAVVAAPVVSAHRDRWPPIARGSAGLVYLTGSHICHQRPGRSFHLAGTPLPICARCVGLHAGAAIGLGAFVLVAGSRRQRFAAHARAWVVLAALPTLASVGLEQAGGPSSLWSRLLTALPFGACAAMLLGLALGGMLSGRVGPNRSGPDSPQPSATLR